MFPTQSDALISMVQATPVIFLDKPTAALDLRYQARVLTVARDLVQARATVVAVLHDFNLAAAYADRIIMFSQGRVPTEGTLWDVLQKEGLSQSP